MEFSQRKTTVAILTIGVFIVILLCMNLVATIYVRTERGTDSGVGAPMTRNDIIIDELKIVDSVPAASGKTHASLMDEKVRQEFLLNGTVLFGQEGSTDAHLDKQAVHLDSTTTSASIRAWSSLPITNISICSKDRVTCERPFIQRTSGKVIPISLNLDAKEVWASIPSSHASNDLTGIYESEAIPVIFN